MRSRDSSVMRPSPVPASGDDVMAGTLKIVRVSIWFDFRTKSCQRKFEREATRQCQRFWIAFSDRKSEKPSSFFLKRPDVRLDLTFPAWTGTIMFNYGPRMCETCCSPFAEKYKSKGKRAQSKIKDKESLREEAARGLQCETHTRRAVQWWQNMEFCALLHTNRHFVFAVFHLSSFPACLVLSVYASEPGSKWLVLRATTPTADDDQSSLITPRSSC